MLMCGYVLVSLCCCCVVIVIIVIVCCWARVVGPFVVAVVRSEVFEDLGFSSDRMECF